MSSIKIKSIHLVDVTISIIFDDNWFQEDIMMLQQLLLNSINNVNIKEVIKGADRQSIRFSWLNTEFILHFDYYSQSCWFSAYDEGTLNNIHDLFHLLTEN